MKMMKNNKNETIMVIGIDHGYGNMKTATRCFPSGVARYDKEPIFQNNLLVYNGMYYQIGEEHKEFCAEKTQDEDYYVLTLAAIARELDGKGMNRETVHIAGTHQEECLLPGLVYCSDCGSKMSYQTNYYKSGEPYHSFRCSSYGNRTVNCTIHHISDKVLYQLSANKELFADVMKTRNEKHCQICGKAFVPKSKNQRYYTECAKVQKRKKAAERQRKKRASPSRF